MTNAVTVSFPAQTQYVSLARTMAAAMAVRADLPIDQLEDLRLAVDEAAAQVVLDAVPGSDVQCVFVESHGSLRIEVRGTTASGVVPATNTFSWTVLTALVDNVTASVNAGEVCLTLHVKRHEPVDA
jgi:serine/threonine-protein kinase RsbW